MLTRRPGRERIAAADSDPPPNWGRVAWSSIRVGGQLFFVKADALRRHPGSRLFAPEAEAVETPDPRAQPPALEPCLNFPPEAASKLLFGYVADYIQYGTLVDCSASVLPLLIAESEFFALPGLGELCRRQLEAKVEDWWTMPARDVVVHETEHPSSGDHVNTDIEIHIPGVAAIEIVFDPRTHTELNFDFITFFKTARKREHWGERKYSGATGWPGVGITPKLVVPGDRVILHYETDDDDGDDEYWGWRMCAREYRPPQEDPRVAEERALAEFSLIFISRAPDEAFRRHAKTFSRTKRLAVMKFVPKVGW